MRPGRTHVHRFTRPISEAADGLVVFGCGPVLPYGGCASTEVRYDWVPSPYAVARAKRRNAARERRYRSAINA